MNIPKFSTGDPEVKALRCEGCYANTHELRFHLVVIGTRSSTAVENAVELVTDPYWLCPYCIAGSVVAVKAQHPEVMAVARMLNELEFRLRFNSDDLAATPSPENSSPGS